MTIIHYYYDDYVSLDARKMVIIPVKPVISVTWIWERVVTTEVVAGFRILKIMQIIESALNIVMID